MRAKIQGFCRFLPTRNTDLQGFCVPPSPTVRSVSSAFCLMVAHQRAYRYFGFDRSPQDVAVTSPVSPSCLGLQENTFCKVLQGIPGNRQDSRSTCPAPRPAAPVVAFPTTEKQGFARVFHGSSCRSHAGPHAPRDANRTSTGSHIAETYVFPTF